MGNQAGKERLSKADVEFLKTNTRYDEVSCDWLRWGHVTGGSPLIGPGHHPAVVQGLHEGLPRGEAESADVYQDLQQVLPVRQRGGVLHTRLQVSCDWLTRVT